MKWDLSLASARTASKSEAVEVKKFSTRQGIYNAQKGVMISICWSNNPGPFQIVYFICAIILAV